MTAAFMIQGEPWLMLMDLLRVAWQELLLRDAHGGYGAGPTRVEGQMGDGLDQLLLRDPVLQRPGEVEPQLFRTVQRDQRGHRDEAAVALRQLGALPHVAEQDLIRQLHELRREVSEHPLCSRRLLAHADPPPAYRPVICSSFSGYRAPWTSILDAARSISRKSSGV